MPKNFKSVIVSPQYSVSSMHLSIPNCFVWISSKLQMFRKHLLNVFKTTVLEVLWEELKMIGNKFRKVGSMAESFIACLCHQLVTRVELMSGALSWFRQQRPDGKRSKIQILHQMRFYCRLPKGTLWVQMIPVQSMKEPSCETRWIWFALPPWVCDIKDATTVRSVSSSLDANRDNFRHRATESQVFLDWRYWTMSLLS